MPQTDRSALCDGKYVAVGPLDAPHAVHVCAVHHCNRPAHQKMVPANKVPDLHDDAYQPKRSPHATSQGHARGVRGKDGARMGGALCCAGACATVSDGSLCCGGGVLVQCMKELADLGELCCTCFQCCCCCCACGDMAAVAA